MKAGWDVIGVDIEDMGGYPEAGNLILADVKVLTGTAIHRGFTKQRRIELVVSTLPRVFYYPPAIP